MSAAKYITVGARAVCSGTVLRYIKNGTLDAEASGGIAL